MSILQNISNSILGKASILQNIAKQTLAGGKINYTDNQPTVTAPAYTFPQGVKPEWQSAFTEAAKRTNIQIGTVVNRASAEHGGTWDPTTRGILDPNDYGLTQLNPSAVATITGSGGGRNYYKDNFGEEFDINNPIHQILGASIMDNYNRQFALPEVGITNPTEYDIFMAYNLGAKGYAEYKAGVPSRKEKGDRYSKMLKGKVMLK